MRGNNQTTRATGTTPQRKEARTMNGAAARLAANIRQAMKDQALSGREVARRGERLTGKKFTDNYVARRLNYPDQRPLIVVSEHLRIMAAVLGLDLTELIRDAIANEDRCPTCGSPDRAVRWDIGDDEGPQPCPREFHDNATCVSRTPSGGPCGEPIEYVAEGGGEVSGWYHRDRTVTAHHHAIPGSYTR